MTGPVVASAQTPPWAALPDGELDPRFGDGGVVPTIGSPGGVAVQEDGKIVVGGGALARYNVDGSLDPTFGRQGIVTVRSLLSAHEAVVGPVVLQPDGKILAVIDDNRLTRFNSDGSPDSGFGSFAAVYTWGQSPGLVLQGDGSIVLVGGVFNSGLFLEGFDGRGRHDVGFGLGGTVRTYPSGEDVATAAALQADGKIVVVGYGESESSSDDEFLLARYTAKGAVDPTFGQRGLVYTDFNQSSDTARAVVIQPDGKIVVSGAASGTFAVARYYEDGTLDATFGAGGKVRTLVSEGNSPGGAVYAMALRPDGKIVVIGYGYSATPAPAQRMTIVQYNPDGTIDNTFGTGGIVTNSSEPWAVDLAVQPDGQLVVVGGSSVTGSNLSRYRYDSARGAFGGVPHPVPGNVEAEDYDLGGPGTGYSDAVPGNDQGFFTYRTDDVDIKASAEGGHAVGWFEAGEWLAYTIDVAREGLYTISARVGSALPGRTFHIEVDGCDVTGPIAVPEFSDWDRYDTVNLAPVALRAGRQVLRVVMGPESYMDFQQLEIVPAPMHVVPGVIEAEDYDPGGSGLGYADLTPGNDGGEYRAEDVDIKASREGGYAVGWMNAGEWLAYTVDVQSDGLYTVSARVGSAFPDRTFHIEIDGRDITGPIAVPHMDDWDLYETVSLPGVALQAGVQTIRVVVGPEDYLDFQWLSLVP